MKLLTEPHEIQSGGLIEQTSFGVGDESKVLEILREKLYSDPLRVIPQEYLSNARDAHREVGKLDLPVTVKLPTILEPSLEIQDFGPGISPERMEKVFTKYGNSTKRNSNLQTGGFGIGAKSAWAYTDQFTITTIVDGTKYFYSAYLDEHRNSKLALLNKEVTTENNGTSITIPIKVSDFSSIKENLQFITYFWKIRPTIKNGNLNYPVLEKVLQSARWEFYRNPYYNYDSPFQHSYAVVDGIPYSIKDFRDKIQDTDRSLVDSLTSRNLILFFETGQVTISANREGLYYNNPTKQAILDLLKDIAKEVAGKVEEQVKTETNLWDALVKANKLKADLYQFVELEKIQWKTHPLVFPHFTNTAFNHNLELLSYENNKIKRRETNNISYYEDVKIVFNDLGTERVKYPYMKTLFLQNPKTRYYVFNFYKREKQPVTSTSSMPLSLNLNREFNQELKDQLQQAHFTELNPIYLSTIIPTKGKVSSGATSSTKKTVDLTKYTTFILENRDYALELKQTQIDLSTTTGYYVVVDDKKILDSTLELGHNSRTILRGLQALLSGQIYAFTPKTVQRAKASQLVLLKTALEKKIKELKQKQYKEDAEKYAYAQTSWYQVITDLNFTDLKNPQILKTVEKAKAGRLLNQEMWSYIETNNFHQLGDLIQQKKTEATKLLDKYPLLKFIHHSFYSAQDAILDYLNNHRIKNDSN